MIHSKQFNNLLRNLQYSDLFALKDLAAAIQHADRSDIQELLGLVNSTPNNELKVKLLSVLSAYLVSHNIHSDVIVTNKPLYDTVQDLLSRGLPIKAKTVLNFILALLATDNSTNNLTVFARNMLRVSGCLMTMCDIFASGMMYQDTWIALCQSIAESCSGCEVNQSHCSHIIPLSVKRCLVNTDVCILLQSLLYNHRRNVQIFFDSGGQNIFTRQLLQHDACMQLLNNIVQTSEQAVQLLSNPGLVSHLRDFVHLYGPYSQVGQWATIILFHLDNRLKGSENGPRDNRLITEHAMDASRNITHPQLTERENTFDINVNKEMFTRRNTSCLKSINVSKSLARERSKPLTETQTEHPQNAKDFNKVPKEDDTTTLFQNVIKEVIYWKSQNNLNSNTFTPIVKPNQFYQKVTPQYEADQQYTSNSQLRGRPKYNYSFEDLANDVNKELSISFSTNINYENNNIMNSFNITKQTIQRQAGGFRMNLKQTEQTFQFSKETQNEVDLENFKPTFVSTPKQQRNSSSSIESKLHNTTKVSYTGRITNRGRICKQYKTNKSKTVQTTMNTTTVKERSMSARLFSAINDSCTTLVKSVKSIFRLKKKDDYRNKNAYDENKENECSFSFTNYMRKRDAILDNENTQTGNVDTGDSNSKLRDSCRTCKDTIVLQHKLDSDEQLQKTIKRLKIGVNMYGCDFKKISKVMWPRDKYMTPNTLYNLYRKLIVNGSHRKQRIQ